MEAAAGAEHFEEAARLRDEIRRLEIFELGLDRPGMSAKAKEGRGPKKYKAWKRR